ncbi:putative bifunctional diguanylate cyclase/phosphodiesterase [Paraburkholderia sp. J63]|uniref:putative bifunctional diguanylate cyclase/phosphodiesterase n=1 Tax=Paraburkholderia sp. J63 TaxID=2805434 RepID=UPI002ABE1C72|nr:EAL domain-containing protein [Paraburkholderia sp. J63]
MLTSAQGDKAWTVGLVRRIYVLRALGYAMGTLPVLSLLHLQHEPVWLLLSVLAVCLIWPHVAWRLAHPSRADAPRRERWNILVDSAFGGWLVAVVHFEPVATVVIVLMFALDNMAIGGWPLFIAGMGAGAVGLMAGAASFGLAFYPLNARIAPIWLPIVFIYPLLFAKTTHDVSVKLLDRSRRLRELSECDSLTGLANRTAVSARLQALLTDPGRSRESVHVVFLDLDAFKTVNDALGHSVGDLLLMEVAARLRACTRPGDIVGRYGGDEFIVVAPGAWDDPARLDLPEAVLAAMAKPVLIDGHELVISASVGVSVYPADAGDAQTLIPCADMAMYAAKNRGRNCWERYRPDMRADADAKLILSARLRRAIEAGALRLHYQPLVDMRDGRVLGVEALVRWYDEIYGEIAPAEFVPIAETSGFVAKLGEWVLREACRQSALWRQMGIAPLRISINLSPLQLQRPNIVETFQTILRETGADPTRLELEVTETALMQQPEVAVRRLHEFRCAGIGVAVDDFGMGYSSLSQLRALPVDRIKIDRAFVHSVDESDTGAIVKAIVTLARALGLSVIAEGVETLAQQEFLLALGCVEAQGYRFSKPLDAESITRLLADGGPLPKPSLAARGDQVIV